jgi:hypothetical protein
MSDSPFPDERYVYSGVYAEGFRIGRNSTWPGYSEKQNSLGDIHGKKWAGKNRSRPGAV